MEQSTSTNLKPQRSIQDYLSLGYLYLLLLGITTDSIYFGFMGINILDYSTIVDVLLSPATYLTKNLAFPVVIFLIPLMSLLLVTLRYRKKNKNKSDNLISDKQDEELLTREQDKANSRSILVLFVAVSIFSAYFGYGLGGGKKVQERLKSGSFTLNHQLTFNDGEILDVYLVDQNSQYVFYVVENGKTVTVSPVEGNIKKIEKLEK